MTRLELEAIALSSRVLVQLWDRDQGNAAKTNVPGDSTEEHENNTYGLPTGAPIRKKLRRIFRDQLKRTIGFVAQIGATIPDHFPSLTDYNDPLASAMTPVLGVYWDKAGKAMRGRLGLDPDDWRVTDPNIHRAIADQALKLSASTNATTDLGIAEARNQLREQLARGLIGQGETIAQLTARVKTIFTRASDQRAGMIAQTEASRAVHAAAEMSARESGVVAGKRWLASANSCPICLAIAASGQHVDLGASFAQVGHDSAYADVRMPPAHPFCRCSILFVLTDDAAHPVPAFAAPPAKP